MAIKGRFPILTSLNQTPLVSLHCFVYCSMTKINLSLYHDDLKADEFHSHLMEGKVCFCAIILDLQTQHLKADQVQYHNLI